MGNRPPMNEDSEDIYDEKVAPLVKQVIEICKEHRIPLVVSCQLSGDLFCTTVIPFAGENARMGHAGQMLHEGFAAFAYTTVTRKAKRED